MAPANKILGLLLDLFPSSIDRLKPECGFFHGPRPGLLPDTDVHEFLQLLRKDNPDIEFGAAQVVLVRDDAARERLPPMLKNSALVMTVAEAKGLEFDDVSPSPLTLVRP